MKGNVAARLLADQPHQLDVEAGRLVGVVEVIVGRLGEIDTDLQRFRMGRGQGRRQHDDTSKEFFHGLFLSIDGSFLLNNFEIAIPCYA